MKKRIIDMKLVRKEFIFPAKEGECHASTLLALRDGTLLAAWFEGSQEGNPDVQIRYSRCENGVWSTPQTVPAANPVQHWNPVLFQMDDDTVWLFYKIGKPIDVWQTMVVRSTNGGKTWTVPEELVKGDTSGGRGPVKNKPLRTASGRILAPASTEHGTCWRCFVDIFEGDGWRKRDIPVADETVGVIQPSLWESPRGHLHALMRSNACRIYRTDSDDEGETWSPCYATELPNNNSGLDCVMTDSGTLVLICNPVEEKGWGRRTPLSVFVSVDNGNTFEKVLDLETEQSEFSYPAVIADGKRLLVTYTYKRETIAFCELTL